MKERTVLTILMLVAFGVMLTSTAQGKPPYATSFDNSCESCHTKDLVPGKMQVSDTGTLTDLGTQLNGKIRGPLKTFGVQAGNIVTLSVDVLDGNDKFAVQLKRLETGGQANDETNVLIWSEANGADNVWTRQEINNPPYFTKDNGNDGGISGSVTPATYTFDLLVDAATPPDFYDLEFAAAGPIAGLGKWYQDEHFYLEVVSPPNAAVIRGGAMYDKWWAVTGLAKPTTDNPLWASRPDTTSNTRTGADTWRCKECHGWDYKGVDGAYAGGSHRTGIAGIFGTTKTAQEVFDLLKTDHAYGTAGLTDEDISDLAAFVTEGLIDTDSIMDANGTFIGGVETGQTLYDSGIGTNIGCAACHGQLGLNPPPGYPDFDDYPGMLSNKNPWEFQHKVRFGQPATAMPSSVAGGGTILDVADLGAYAQTLPQEPAP